MDRCDLAWIMHLEPLEPTAFICPIPAPPTKPRKRRRRRRKNRKLVSVILLFMQSYFLTKPSHSYELNYLVSLNGDFFLMCWDWILRAGKGMFIYLITRYFCTIYFFTQSSFRVTFPAFIFYVTQCDKSWHLWKKLYYQINEHFYQ